MQRLRNSFRSPQWLLYKLLIIRRLYPPPKTEESVYAFVKYAVITFTIKTFTKYKHTKISCPLQVAKGRIFHLGKIISYLSTVSVLQEFDSLCLSKKTEVWPSRFKASVPKTDGLPKGPVSSNLTPSANARVVKW